MTTKKKIPAPWRKGFNKIPTAIMFREIEKKERRAKGYLDE